MNCKKFFKDNKIASVADLKRFLVARHPDMMQRKNINPSSAEYKTALSLYKQATHCKGTNLLLPQGEKTVKQKAAQEPQKHPNAKNARARNPTGVKQKQASNLPICQLGQKNGFTVNPITGKKLGEKSSVKKLYVRFCKEKNQQGVCDKMTNQNFAKNPFTNRALNPKSAVGSQFKIMCGKLIANSKTSTPKAKPAAKPTVDEVPAVYNENILGCTLYPKSKILLQAHQLAVCKHLEKHPRLPGMLLFHSVGSGKTLTAITIIRCILEKDKTRQIFVVTPKSLVDNFHKEVKKLQVQFGSNVVIMTHNMFLKRVKANGPSFCKDAVLVIDEAHKFRGDGNTNGEKGLMFKATEVASQTFLLSATPVQNNPLEFVNMHVILTRKQQTTHDVFKLYENFEENAGIIKRELQNSISYYKNSSGEGFPSTTTKNVYFEMPPLYYEAYMNIEESKSAGKGSKNLHTFYNGLRAASNNLDSSLGYENPKMEWALNYIRKNHAHKKILLYTNWIKAGILVVAETLKREGIRFVQVTGSMSKQQRTAAVESYNSGKSSVLLISSSGGEGLDLKGTSTVIVMEPHWNEEKLKQVIGRAVRLHSHAALPPAQQKVEILHLVLKKPHNVSDKLEAVDEYLIQMAREKSSAIDKFYKVLIDVSV